MNAAFQGHLVCKPKANKHMGCPGTWHGHWHAHAVPCLIGITVLVVAREDSERPYKISVRPRPYYS